MPLPLRDYLHRLPTTDLYFLNPLRALGRMDDQPARLPETRNLAPNVYSVGQTGVIVRYGRQADLDLLRHAGVRRIVYIVDDDFAAGADDPRLPSRYRAKLAAFCEDAWPALRDAADIVLVPGSVLAAAYGAKARIVPPAWHRQPAPSDHFDRSRQIELIHLGTGSHITDLADLAPALAGILSTRPEARLTLFSGKLTPVSLLNHPQVRVRRPLSWWRYKLLLPRMRYHLALYPLADTAFNRARSANKLYEHALVGAASLMTPNAALREAAGPDLADLFVEAAEDWAGRLEADLADMQALRHRTDRTRERIMAADPLDCSVRTWRDILAPEFS